jgi:hypothetical protein
MRTDQLFRADSTLLKRLAEDKARIEACERNLRRNWRQEGAEEFAQALHKAELDFAVTINLIKKENR